MNWMIMGHVYGFITLVPQISFAEMQDAIKNSYWLTVISSGLYSVDVFFYLSGYLVTYLFLEQLFRSGSINVLKVYFHRYYRLIFPIAAITLFGATLERHLYSGPTWEFSTAASEEMCVNYWWTNFIFL